MVGYADMGNKIMDSHYHMPPTPPYNTFPLQHQLPEALNVQH